MIPGPIYLTILFTLIVGAVQGEMMRRNQTVGTTFSVWLAVTGVLGYTAKMHDFSRQPSRIMALIALSVVGVYFGSYFAAARKLIESPGLAWLIGLQVFRVAVEIFLDLGYRAGFVPVQMTLEGRNWDVLTGLTALPMAWLVAEQKEPRLVVYAWDAMGLALVVYVMAVAALSMPTPPRHFQNDPPNTC